MWESGALKGLLLRPALPPLHRAPSDAGLVNSPGERKTSRGRPTSWLAYLGALVHGQSCRRGAISALYAATDPWLQGAWVPAGGLHARGCLQLTMRQVPAAAAASLVAGLGN
jgi:hypothetical protein